MCSAVGQQPPVTEKIVSWVMEAATIPVIVKLTPNITDVVYAARAARKGGGDAISLINTINSITQVNLDNLVPEPFVAGLSSHGGYKRQSEEHTSEIQSRQYLVCRLLLEKKKKYDVYSGIDIV